MSERAGIAYLVGAGPGDPGLLTARALELIATADAILYDRLIPAGALDGARSDAELLYVGKRPGAESMAQEAINALLVELTAEGRSVVRLKGGDPFVFGRGGEEASALAERGLAFEIVPGVTAGVAAPAYAGIPVTHRERASGVALVTGHEDPAKPDSALDWPALAAFPGTLVLYMGVAALERIAERLVAGGRPSSEPVAVIERGTLPAQRTVTGTLADIAGRAAAAQVRAPAVTVIGVVVDLHERLSWAERRPLHGRTVLVTRARAQASGLAARLEALGAAAVEAPAIRIEARPIDAPEIGAALDAIDSYALVCVTSANAAELLLDALSARGRDARALAGATIAAVGPATVAVLRARGIRADVVPERSTSDALALALASRPLAGRRALVVRPGEARDTIPRALAQLGASVEEVALYDTLPEPLDPSLRERIAAADYATFTSSSTVRYLLEALGAGAGAALAGTRIASIGPATSATARELGLEVHVEAARHDVEGLVDALVLDASA